MARSRRPAPSAPSPAPVPAPASRTELTAVEIAVVGAGVGAAVVGSASLGCAMAGVWSLGAVALASVAVGALAAAAVWGGVRHSLAPSPTQVRAAALVVPGLAIAVALVVPGFGFGMAGWDPGVYQNHAVSIAETGRLDRPNPPVVLGLDPSVERPRLPGVPPDDDDPDRLQFAFFHFYPALGAVAYAIAPTKGIPAVNPVLALVALAAIGLAVRRLLDAPTALAATIVVATNAVWVWHARWPSSEMVVAALGAVAVLAGAMAWDSRHHRWWIGAGLCLGAAADARLDGILVLVVAAVVVGLLVLAGRPGAAGWLAVGLVPGTVLWLLEAAWTADAYTAHRSSRNPLLVVVPLAAPAIGALVLRRVLPRVVAAAVDAFRSRRGVAPRLAFALIVAAHAALWVRHLRAAPAVIGDENSFDAHTIWRTLLFVGPIGVGAALVGIGYLMIRSDAGLRSIPLLVPGLATLPIFLVDPVIHPRLIWATRRVVPFGWVPLLVLVAVGVAAPLVWSTGRRRPVGAVVTVLALGAVVAGQVPLDRVLRGHDELAGSEAFAEDIAGVVGDGVAVWVQGEAFSAFASTVLVRWDIDVVPVTGEQLAGALADLDTIVGDRPVFVVADVADPDAAAVADLTPVTTVAGRYDYLGFTYFELPHAVEQLPFAAEVLRYDPRSR